MLCVWMTLGGELCNCRVCWLHTSTLQIVASLPHLPAALSYNLHTASDYDLRAWGDMLLSSQKLIPEFSSEGLCAASALPLLWLNPSDISCATGEKSSPGSVWVVFVVQDEAAWMPGSGDAPLESFPEAALLLCFCGRSGRDLQGQGCFGQKVVLNHEMSFDEGLSCVRCRETLCFTEPCDISV